MRRDAVVVIGGGLSGLTAAALLSKQGRSVRVVEANGKVGGCCGTATIGGYTFNDGALFVALRGMLERVCQRIGVDLATAVPMHRIRTSSTTLLPDGTAVTCGEGLEVTVEGGRSTPDGARTRAELGALDRAWEPLVRSLSEDLLLREPSGLRMLASAWRLLPRLARTVGWVEGAQGRGLLAGAQA